MAGLWVSNDTGTHHGIVLRHNTIYNSNGRGVRIDAPPAWSSVTFSDNLIASATGNCFQDVSGAGTRITASNHQFSGCASQTIPNDGAFLQNRIKN